MPPRYNFNFKVLTARYPFLKSAAGSNLLKIIGVIRTVLQAVTSSINDTYDARFINTAIGSDLDKHGITLDLSRNPGESDIDYKARLLTEFRDIPEGLTVASLKNAVNQVLGSDPAVDEYFRSIWEWPDESPPTYSHFGNTSVGASSILRLTNQKVGCKFYLSADETMDLRTITAYLEADGDGTRTAHCAIYADNAGAPAAKIADADHTVTVGEAGWYTFSFTDVQLNENNDFWLAINVTGGSWRYYYDAGSSNQTATIDDTPPPDDPFGTPTYDDRSVSIYASYHYFEWAIMFNSIDSRFYVAAVVSSTPTENELDQIEQNVVNEKPSHIIVRIVQEMPSNYSLLREIK